MFRINHLMVKYLFVFLIIIINLSSISFAEDEYPDVELQDESFENDVYTNYGYYLNKLGYFKDTDTDIYDINLRNGVLRFQAAQNLNVDGDFGPITLKGLIKGVVDSNSENENYVYNDNLSNFASNGKWVTVNLTKKILTLYKKDIVLKKYPLALGSFKQVTPNGKFIVVNKLIDPYWGGAGIHEPIIGGSPENPLGKRWLGLSVGGGSMYGIHGNADPYSIGSHISRGCIRMINSDVVELFDQVPIGTNIWIGNQTELQNWGISM